MSAVEKWHTLSSSAQYRQTLEHMGRAREAELSTLERGRIQATLDLIPSDAATLLDVGAGDGRLLQQLPQRIWAAGADYAFASVAQIRPNGICASSQQLPFRDQSFDIVLCCEVLEHLPDGMFQAVLKELERVASTHILVTVPYKENRAARLLKCPQCQCVFHMWGHVRHFGETDLNTFFHNFEVTTTTYHGRRPPYQHPQVLALNQRFGNRWTDQCDTSICPQCGNTDFARAPRNAVTVICGLLNLLTAYLTSPSEKNWVLKLYTRKV